MKTFLAIYVGAQAVLLVGLFFFMAFTPVERRLLGYSRFRQNWVQGGNLMFYVSIVLALIIAFGLTKWVLWFNFLER